ncbi:MAG: DUF3857 domain-containing protein [Gemmatimonadota bacterium]
MRRLLLAGLLCSGISSVSAQAAYRIGPPAAWVKIHNPNFTAPPVRTEGWEYVLTDRQESVGPSGIERYWHAAYRVLDQAAVGDNSQIQVVFDPTYQRLTLHTVTVWRRGRASNQLEPARIRVAQRETDLESRIFDGSLTVIVVLEDVRPGDIIEYSYTRAGGNPVLRGHYMAMLQFQYDAPVTEQHVRLLWRRSQSPQLRSFGDIPPPTITADGSSRQYEWSRRNVPALRIESDLPDWFVAYPTIQISDFASWRAVAAWGDSLFANATLPPALRDVVERIRSSSESDERRALQALRWVQDEIRYTGVEIGVNSHKPFSPAVVIKRRYGDCKDKALLLVTMLRALGIAAHPALVSTTYGGHEGDYAPTAALFDHAIVALLLNGRQYWIDPTDVDQRGGIADVAAYYGSGLVLGGSSDSLSTMPDLRPSHPTTDIVVSFDIGAVNAPTTMKVETSYFGRSANRMRASRKRSSSEELQQSYLEYYAKLYPSIRSEQPLTVQDDEAGNVLRSVEHYTIPNFWTGDSTDGQGLTGKFEPLELSSLIPAATAGGRTMPLGVSHPVHVRYVIKAHLENGWSIRNRHADVATPGAKFKFDVSAKNKVLTLFYEYETLADHVLPAATTDHGKGMARISDMMVFTVTPPSQSGRDKGHINWPVLFAGLCALLLASMAALRVSRSPLALASAGSPARVSAPPASGEVFRSELPREDPVGLGGWLVLVGFGVTLSPLRVLFTMIKSLPGYSASTWAALTTPGAPAYHALWAPGLLIELVANITLLVFACLLIYLFYRKKRQFPIVFIGVMLLNVFIILFDAALMRAIPGDEPGSTGLGAILPGLIWSVYMLRSRRVRNTFVH